MKWFFILIFITTMAQGKECNFSLKGVKSPLPKLPESVLREDKWDEAFRDTWNELCLNLKRPNTFFKGYRAHPGPPFKAAYLWDTAFISQVWLHWDTAIAENLIHYILRFQKADGKIHHAVVELLVKPHPYKETQPPLLAWASWRIFQKSKNVEFLKSVYPKLKNYHGWLLKHRQNKDGLFFWKHPYESGIDNSPRFSNRDESKFEDTTKMAAVDFSSYMALSMESLALMARELGYSDDVKTFDLQYVKVKTVMNAKLWDPVKAMYFDWDYKTKSFVHMETISNLTPMIAGIPDQSQAKLMLTKILDPIYYNTKIPFPSVARSESVFVKDMWRGPVWINMAYLGVLGVDRYGHRDEAAYLAKKLVTGIYETWKNTGYIYEFYDPDRFDIEELSRKKGNLFKKITLGSKPVKKFVGWSGLVNSLVMEYGEKFSKPRPKDPIVDLAPLNQIPVP